MSARFLPLRGIKVVAWTAAAVTWSTAVLAKVVSAEPLQPQAVDNGATAQVQDSSVKPAVPTMPAGGLLVIKTGPAEITPPPPVRIVRRVVQAPTPKQTTRQTSKGS